MKPSSFRERVLLGLEKAAEMGDAAAQADLGYAYYSGGRTKDLQKATALLTKAAEQGHAMAQATLGVIYSKENNMTKAVELWAKAAEQGHPIAIDRLEEAAEGSNQRWATDAQASLGLSYYTGLGVPKDLRRAAELWMKAANSSNADAQAHLDAMYANGEGVIPDERVPEV